MPQLKKLVIFLGVSVILLINNTSVLSSMSQLGGAPSTGMQEKLFTSTEFQAASPSMGLPIQGDVFIDQLAEDTWAYLSSDWATDNHLPWSWRSASLSGGDYANTTEIGFYALSWLAAYDMQETWSPDWNTTESEVTAILDQLRAWQTDPLGDDSYNNSVFYQGYWINSSPPSVGGNVGDNLVPSIDNAWLAASLITIREYAEVNGHTTIAQKADAILTDMDFSLWYNTDTHLFSWGAIEDPQAGTPADYYSNENRIINFVARAIGDLDANEFALSLAALEQSSGIYDGITVEKMAYDGSYFTYTGPALFIREMQTSYGTNTLNPATQAQIQYASNSGYKAWGLSDAYDIESGPYLQQGASPVAMPGSPEVQPGLISPHASTLALITEYDTSAVANLQFIADTYDCAYDDTYGFLDSVIANVSSADNGKCSYRFSALNQEWIFLSVSNYMNGFVWEYFYKDEGVVAAHVEMYEPIVSANKNSVDFGDQLYYTKSNPKTTILTNFQSSDVHIGSFIRSSGQFILSSNNCAGATLTPGQSCTFNLQFKPTVYGALSGTLTINSDAVNNPVVISLNGTGLPGTQLVTKGGSFEQDKDNNGIPDFWTTSGLTGLDGRSSQFAKHGIYSMKIVGQSGKTKILKQTIAKNGSAGDDFLYVLWSKAQTVPSGFKYRTQVSFYNGASLVESRIKDYTAGTHDWEYRWLPITVSGNYTRIEVEIIYSLSSGIVWFDSGSLKWAP